MNTKIFGNMGVGKAISYFSENSYIISIPLNDSQKYDLIVDLNNKIYKISVKSSNVYSKYGIPKVHIKTSGGNKSSNYSRPFDKSSCDFLFIYVPDKGSWLIPSYEVLAKNQLCMGLKYEKYRINLKD